jgi:hypothetical protein
MLSRRTFIKTALASNAALLTTPSQALQLLFDNSQAQPLLVFADETALNAKDFISGVKNDGANLGLDIGRHFDLLATFCKDSPNGQIMGLTRDSDFFVLEQLAKDFGFYTSYSASHRYDGQTLTHQVTAAEEPATIITTSLTKAGEQWPAWLAKNLHALPQKHQQTITTKSQLNVANAEPHDFLVSWSLSTSKSI